MLLFNVIADITKTELYEKADYRPGPMSASLMSRAASEVHDLNDKLYQVYTEEHDSLALIYDITDTKALIALAVTDDKLDVDEALKKLGDRVKGIRVLSIHEITREVYKGFISRGNTFDLIYRGVRSLFDDLSLYLERGFFDEPMFELKEEVLSDRHLSMNKCLREAEDIMASDDFREEIGRIYSKKNRKAYFGHPVHYLISAGDYNAAMDMVNILIPALRRNNRLVGGRTTQMRKIHPRAYKHEDFEKIFASADGGVVIIDFSGVEGYGNYATGYVELANAFGSMIKKYGKDTLFIFIDVSSKSEITGAAISALQSNADMIHLTEGYGDYDRALTYMKKIASRAEFTYSTEDELTKYLPTKVSYSVSDVFTAYNLWYSKGLKSHVYRAYAEVDSVKIEVKAHEDKPYERLMNMIGLTDVKKVCDQIIDTCKMEQIRKSMGLDNAPISKHMLFAGNPGTAKTTVARLLAQILKREGILENGHIVECGRQDLVGRYVGWTAQIVQEKFREARGGILFIDEAYSLVDESRTFGDEAINTIVQQMENYRDEVMVIFAGYTDKMKEFLAKNEGLNSRIAFHLNFPDYDSDELMGILDLMLKDQGLTATPEARAKCIGIFDEARTNDNYGNGRFVRNMLEQARMHQCSRLMSECRGGSVDKDTVCLLTEDDFEMPFIAVDKKTYHMGF